MKVIVIGSGIAGLLAARVLSAKFDTVIVVDRDDLNSPEIRKGTPQAHHIHALLARGLQLIEAFYPGIISELHQCGVPEYNWTQDILILLASGYALRIDTGLETLALSRQILEQQIQVRTQQISNIIWASCQEVKGLVCENGTIIGIQTLNRKTHETDTLFADLVVDASGSRSKTPQWLCAVGYPEPQVTQINPFLGYASRWYSIPEGVTLDVPSIMIQPRANQQFYRGAAAVRTEGDQVVITLAGANKDYPPAGEAAFETFAKSLPDPIVHQWIQTLDPISPIYSYRCFSQIRHYEKLKQFPENFLVIGDAFCFFNPIYGQGMTIAAMEAELLQKMLSKPNVLMKGFGRRFHRRLARLITLPWIMTTAEDLRYPLAEGGRPSLALRMAHKYLDFFIHACIREPALGLAFVKVMHMVAHPASLVHPRVLFYVLRALLRRK